MADKTQTTNRSAKVIYHGEVFRRGEGFLKIEAENGGYAPLVTVTCDLPGGQVQLWLDPEEAAEMARHLLCAAESANGQ